jgi:phosphohistidine phosphatase
MKTLILHRHAKSSWDHPNLIDFERPLNNRGKHDAPEMGKRLLDKSEKVELFVSSPAVRAISTARLVAKELGYPVGKITEERNIYMAGVRTLLNVVNNLDDQINSVMLFGHNPGFTEFAEYLTDEYLGNIPTCGQVKITFSISTWKMVSQGTGKMEWFDFPKNGD